MPLWCNFVSNTRSVVKIESLWFFLVFKEPIRRWIVDYLRLEKFLCIFQYLLKEWLHIRFYLTNSLLSLSFCLDFTTIIISNLRLFLGKLLCLIINIWRINYRLHHLRGLTFCSRSRSRPVHNGRPLLFLLLLNSWLCFHSWLHLRLYLWRERPCRYLFLFIYTQKIHLIQ